MTVSLLDGRGATMFAQVFGGLYVAGRIVDTAVVYDNGGSVTSSSTTYRDCRVQVDRATQAMRTSDGYADGDAAFYVLAGTLVGSLTTDAQIEVLEGPHIGTWMVSAWERDPLGAYWLGRGRRG